MTISNFAVWWSFCMSPDRDGLANDTCDGDGAGITRFGWTYPTWTEAKSYIQGAATLELFMAMNREQAGTLAQIYHWNRQGGRLLRGGADVVVLDWSWTSGGAIREIQERVGVVADGALGPITAAAINAFPDFLTECSNWREAYYDGLEFRDRFPGLYRRLGACLLLGRNLEQIT